jgi:NAD(P)H-dependent FMN reductase
MIEVIVGTNRPGSNAARIAKLLFAEYIRLGVPAQVLNLGDLPHDLFVPGSYAAKPASFAPFQERVLAASGLHLIVPEYNGSFPGVLKYFVDLLKFPESFERRPVAFVGEAAGMWGGLRGVEQIEQIFGYRNALALPERVFVPRVNDALTPDGAWNDAHLAGKIAEQCAKFAEFIARLKE